MRYFSEHWRRSSWVEWSEYCDPLFELASKLVGESHLVTTLELLNRFWLLSHWRVGGGINEKKSIETKRGENYEILYLGAVT